MLPGIVALGKLDKAARARSAPTSRLRKNPQAAPLQKVRRR